MRYTLNDGITVRDINDDYAKNHLWIEGYLKMNDSFNPILMRPREKYLCANFEVLFQFASKCTDYDENKMIGVTQSYTFYELMIGNY
jgi:hypothetical protein